VTDPGLAALVQDPRIWLLFFAWGFAEAVLIPIVPDVGLGVLALATPEALGLPLLSAIAGGVAGAAVLAALRARDPAPVDRILALQPGLGAAGMDEARRRIAARGPRAFAQVGPGLPLKAYVVAYVQDRPSARIGTVALLALLNRVTRIVPVVGAFALAGVLARPLEPATGPVLACYVVGWALFYGVFWWVRRPRDRPYQHL
jgi:hypothetical protein